MNPMGIRTTTGRAHKAPADSRVTLAHIMSEHDTNLYGTIHGGVVMKLIDDAAAPPRAATRTAPPSPSR